MKDRSAGRSVLVSVLVTEKRDLWMNKNRRQKYMVKECPMLVPDRKDTNT